MKKSSKGLLAVTIIFILVTIITCIVVFQFYLRGFREEEEKTIYDRYYVMITEDRKSSFWQSVYQGAYERGLENGIYVDLLGDNLSEDYTKEELMEIAISSDVDGIIVAADESEEMTELINKADSEGIPVATIYGDNSKSKRCSFASVGSYNLGREYGKQILKIANFTGELNMNVAVLGNSEADDSGQNILQSAIRDTIDHEKGTYKHIELSTVLVDDTNAFSVEESIRDIFMEGSIPDIIVCSNELNTTCVYQAVVDYNRVGRVHILGYYDSDTILNAIDRSVIYATVSIDTKKMGGFCVDALKEYHELGYTSQYFTTDIELINKGNVSSYLKGGDEHDE